MHQKLFIPQEWTLKISDEDLELLREHYKESDIRDAYDNLYRALWGCGCCESHLVDSQISNGIRGNITDVVIEMIEGKFSLF